MFFSKRTLKQIKTIKNYCMRANGLKFDGCLVAEKNKITFFLPTNSEYSFPEPTAGSLFQLSESRTKKTAY
jgi:hypothetical protein